MHRFFLTPEQIAGPTARFNSEQSRQMRHVLSLRPGDRVLALNGLGGQYEVALTEVSDTRVVGQVVGQVEAAGEPDVRLTLYQSLLRREKFEWVLQKGTEIGVAAFAPVITRRSLVRDTEDVTPEKLTRWQRIIKEAAEQSGRGLLPELSPPVQFGAALGSINADCAIIAWEGDTPHTIREALRPGGRSVALFIGPEGGFDPDEVNEATACGVIPVTMGRRILRTETAAIVGAALILHELGEME